MLTNLSNQSLSWLNAGFREGPIAFHEEGKRIRRVPGAAEIDSRIPAAVHRAARGRLAARIGTIAALACVDALSLLLSVALGYLLWAKPVLHHSPQPYWELLPLVGLFTIGYAKAGLYPGFGIGPVETLRRLTLRTLFVALTLAAASYALGFPLHYSRLTFGIALAISLPLMPLVRHAVVSLLSRFKLWGEPVVIVGTNATACKTARSLNRGRSLGYRPIAMLTLHPAPVGTMLEGIPLVGGLETVPRFAKMGICIALLADWNGAELDQDESILGYLEQHFRQVISIRSFSYPRVEGAAVRNLGGVLCLEFTNHLLMRNKRILKRCVDIVLGGLGTLLAGPIVGLAAILVKLVSPGPAFFSQQREGLGGRPIKVWKLRTMHTDAEARLERHLQDDAGARNEWNTCFKLSDDPRIIPLVGRVLRRFSIDELPQFWNVAVGNMSLVGPRPFPEYHLKAFHQDFRELRRRVRPGLTGLWQVMVRSDGGTEEQQIFDTYYIRNWSIWMDLYILANTAKAVIYGRGAR